MRARSATNSAARNTSGGDQAADHDRRAPARDPAPLETPSTSPVSPIRNVSVPGMSNDLSSDRPVSSRRIRNAHKLPASANGTLNQNTQCHEISDERASEHGPDHQAHGGDHRVGPHRQPELLAREGVCHDRRSVREQERAADSLEDPPHDQLGAAAGEAGAERSQRKNHEAADVRLLAPELIGQPAGAQDEHGRGDHVHEDHPHELEEARVETPLEIGQRDDQRPRVDRRERTLPRLVHDSAHHFCTSRDLRERRSVEWTSAAVVVVAPSVSVTGDHPFTNLMLTV